MTIKTSTKTKRKTTQKKTNENQEPIAEQIETLSPCYHNYNYGILTADDLNSRICKIADDESLTYKEQTRGINELVDEQRVQINSYIDDGLALLANTSNQKAESLNVMTTDLIPTGKSKNFFREVVVSFHEKNSALIDMSSGDSKNALKLQVDCLRSFINMRLNQDSTLLPIVEDANRKAGYEMIGGKFDSKGKYTTSSRIS